MVLHMTSTNGTDKQRISVMFSEADMYLLNAYLDRAQALTHVRPKITETVHSVAIYGLQHYMADLTEQ